jgi:hypothetical protein
MVVICKYLDVVVVFRVVNKCNLWLRRVFNLAFFIKIRLY